MAAEDYPHPEEIDIYDDMEELGGTVSGPSTPRSRAPMAGR